MRLEPGAPGIGRIDRIPVPPLTISYVVNGPICTSEVLSEAEGMTAINQAGESALKELLKRPTLTSFMQLSRGFTVQSGLASDWTLEAIEAVEAAGGMASMIMLGDAVFAFGEAGPRLWRSSARSILLLFLNEVPTLTDIPKSHPRYASLVARERVAKGVKKGFTSSQGLIAQGRGECFDYLLGERTTPSAEAATHRGCGPAAPGKAAGSERQRKRGRAGAEEMVALAGRSGFRWRSTSSTAPRRG